MENVPGEALDGGATGVCWGQSHLRASVVGLKLLLELFEHMGEGYWGQRVRQVGAGVGQASGAHRGLGRTHCSLLWLCGLCSYKGAGQTVQGDHFSPGLCWGSLPCSLARECGNAQTLPVQCL